MSDQVLETPPYWVHLGRGDYSAWKEDALTELWKLAPRRQIRVRPWFKFLIFITHDLEEARRVARKAAKIWLKYCPDTPVDDLEYHVYIHTQPQCPKCHTLGSLKDRRYCSKCGDELESEEFPIAG